MKNTLKAVFVIVGALIGAGFASGQEIYIFFLSNGTKGILAIAVASVIEAYIIYKVFYLVNKYKIENYKTFLEKIIPDTKNKNFIIQVINNIINLFIIITFFIMISGFGVYFNQEFNINPLIGSGILATINFIVLLSRTKGVVKSSECLIPALIIIIFVIGIVNTHEFSIEKIEEFNQTKSQFKWLKDGIIYSSYNTILIIPVLITLKDLVKNHRQITRISIIICIITILLSIIIFLQISQIENINELEMPMLYEVSTINTIFKILYGFIILIAIFTTSASLGMSFLQNTVKNEKSYPHTLLIMCIASVIISKIGFSNLMNLIYPIFGYFGLIQIFETMKTV